MPKPFYMWMKWRTRIGFYFLGVLTTLIIGGSGVAVWNPIGKIEKERVWFNQRIYGATDTFNNQLSKIQDARLDNYKSWAQLWDEFNKPVPDEQKLVEHAVVIRQGLAKVSILSDTACNEYRKFILGDPIDAKQRGGDADRLCELLGGFKEAVGLEEKALEAILNTKFSLDERANQYKSFTSQADDKVVATLKQIGKFEPSPLTLK